MQSSDYSSRITQVSLASIKSNDLLLKVLTSAKDVQFPDGLEKLNVMIQLMPIYELQVQLSIGLAQNQEECRNMYNKAVTYYKIKEYQHSYTMIVNAVCNKHFPVNNAVIKLLVADIQCMGYANIAKHMYVTLFEYTKELDCLFYAGLCGYSCGNYQFALEQLSLFLNHVNGSARHMQYASLVRRADCLIKNIQSAA